MNSPTETSDQARQARRERIAAGKPDPDDCTSDTEVICPYCGEPKPSFATETWWIPPGGRLTATILTECPSCEQDFLVEVRIYSHYQTRKPEGRP